jgi:hypothetical protein
MTPEQAAEMLDLQRQQLATTQDLVAAAEKQAEALATIATALQDLVGASEKR